MNLIFQKFLLLVLLIGAQQSFGQDFFYVEPGNPACPVVSAPAPAPAKMVKSGVAILGSIRVGCGFDKGSYKIVPGELRQRFGAPNVYRDLCDRWYSPYLGDHHLQYG
jgi:hypothetical protein